jgi:hypothetical protein
MGENEGVPMPGGIVESVDVDANSGAENVVPGT